MGTGDEREDPGRPESLAAVHFIRLVLRILLAILMQMRQIREDSGPQGSRGRRLRCCRHCCTMASLETSTLSCALGQQKTPASTHNNVEGKSDL